MAKAALVFVFLAFGAYSSYVTATEGFLSFFTLPFAHGITTQIFLDLMISLTLFQVWMVLDWRKQGRPLYQLLPYLVATPFVGSFSPLVYLLLRPDYSRLSKD